MKSKLAIALGIAVAYLLVGCSTPSPLSNGEQATGSAKRINVVAQHHLSLSLQVSRTNHWNGSARATSVANLEWAALAAHLFV